MTRWLIILLGALTSGHAIAAEVPRQDGLILWLDAADASTREMSGGKGVVSLKDKSGRGHHANSNRGPWVIKNALGGREVLRFQNRQSLTVPKVLEGRDKVTVFIAFHRVEDLKSERGWQKVLSSGTKDGVFVHTGAESGPMSARVLRATFHGIDAQDLYIGKGGPNEAPSLTGDVAEILVYDRDFYVESQMREIVSYLEKKWSFKEDRDSDWTHVGPLPDTPERLSDSLPLSDQENKGGWTRFEPMWDEFEGDGLNARKWWDHNPDWYGRAPARYLAREVEVADGELKISMRKDTSLPVENLYRDGTEYRDYSSGTIKSKSHTVYGYFEIEAMPMASAGSSAWWFTGKSWDKRDKGNHAQEIDVFELGGKSIGRENIYSMNLHVFQTPKEKRHWNRGGEWEAPFDFKDDFHVFGLEWSPEFLRYYVDGVMVRSVKNDGWHAPQQMIFDSETMIDWLGAPRDEDLPSVFRVRYVRAWKNGATRSDWRQRYSVKDPTKPTRISRYVREMAEKHQ
ncbi:MAG: family 16 glycosylhydrolase [Verrucomicrobiota bacterium]